MSNRYSSTVGTAHEEERQHMLLRPAWRSFWREFTLIFVMLSLSISVDMSFAGLVIALTLVTALAVLRYRLLYTVTSQRVIVRAGIIARNTKEVEIRHTRELQVRQGIVERLLSYGTVEITTAAGIGPAIILSQIVNPHALKEAIRHMRNGL